MTRSNAQAPQDGAVDAGEHASDEQCNRGGVDSAKTAAGDLVQGAKDQPALRQMGVNLRSPERHDTMWRPAGPLNAGDQLAQLVENSYRCGRHTPPNGERKTMFLFCSIKLGASTPT
ncbi:MAG: hypothetical protein AB7H90_21610 [Alphaproteobacteria bacterium]